MFFYLDTLFLMAKGLLVTVFLFEQCLVCRNECGLKLQTIAVATAEKITVEAEF